MFWNEDFLAKRRNEWLRQLDKFQFYANGEWHDATITEKRVDGNSLKITAIIDGENINKVTGIRILDAVGNIAGERSDTLDKKTTQGLLTMWEFPIYEIE